MPVAGVSHHITIANVGGTNKTGFMLARRRGRDLAYAIEDAEQVQPRVLSMGELTEAEAPPQLRMYWTMEDWRVGVGGVTDREHKRRLAKSVLIDGTARGALRPAHAFVTSTVDSAASTIIASGFWTVGTELWAGIGRDVYIWDFDNDQWDIKTEPENASLLYRNGVEFDSRTYVPSWDTTIDLPWFYLFKRDSDTEMTQSTITKKPKYIVTGRDSAGNQALWGGFCLFGSGTLLNDGTNINSSDTALVLDGTDATTKFSVGDFLVMDQEIMRVTVVGATSMTVVRGELNSTAASHNDNAELYQYFPHGIMNSTDGTNSGSWSNIIKVGTIDAEITALVQDGESLVICKTDGIWVQFRDGTTVNMTPEFEAQQHPDNFRGAFNWNGHIILPGGPTGTLFELFEGRLFDISIKHYAPQVTEWHGQVAAVGGDPTHLYILVNDATNTKYHILMAEWSSFESQLDWRWHHIGQISYTTGTTPAYAAIFAESQQDTDNTDPHHRVWFGIRSTGGTSPLPSFTVSSSVDDVFAFSNDAAMLATFPDFDGNFPRIPKNCVAVDIDSTNLGAAGRQWTLEYSLDGASFLSDLTDSAGNADGVVDATGGAETLTFPAGTTAKIVTLRGKPASTSETSTPPEINKVRVTFQLRPERLRLLPMTFYLADGITLLNGALGGQIKADLAQIRTWDAQAAAVTVVDIEGVSRDYVFLPGNMTIKPRKQQFARRREFLVSIILAEE